MNESTMLNLPVEFSLAGKRHSFVRLSSAIRRAVIQTAYLDKVVAEIAGKAKAFPDPSDQKAYISEQVGKLPCGDELTKAAMSVQIDDDLIVRLMARSGNMSIDQAEVAYHEATGEEVRAVLEYVTGSKKK